jgi:hypothetical protein
VRSRYTTTPPRTRSDPFLKDAGFGSSRTTHSAHVPVQICSPSWAAHAPTASSRTRTVHRRAPDWRGPGPSRARERAGAMVAGPPSSPLAIMRRALKKETLSAHTALTANRLVIVQCMYRGRPSHGLHRLHRDVQPLRARLPLNNTRNRRSENPLETKTISPVTQPRRMQGPQANLFRRLTGMLKLKRVLTH